MRSVRVHRAQQLQAGPSAPGPGPTAPCSLGLQGPNFELVKLQKALTSTMVKASLSLHAEIFAFIFLCVVVAFKLNQKEEKRKGRISTPDLSSHSAGCVSSPTAFCVSKAPVPSEDAVSAAQFTGQAGGALCFPEASGG